MLVSNDAETIARAKFLATQARDPEPHYEHTEIGFNYRLSNICAGIGRGQLQVLEERVASRRRNFAFYQATLADLPGIEFMPEADFGKCTRWLSCLTFAPERGGIDRETVRLKLLEQQIETRPVWKPMHLQPVFKQCECINNGVAEELFARGLCLPSGSNLTDSELERGSSRNQEVVSQITHF